MNYKTEFKTLKKVYAIAKQIGLESIFTATETPSLDFEKIMNGTLESDLINEFCQTVTGSDEDFENKTLTELESVILGFFGSIKEQLKDSLLIKAIAMARMAYLHTE